ncbi:hypothetical protein VIGAN_06054500 [Vigna angularis var. angularis]|uniref:Uncharacterized protein n=1 Tax=Vigna angularis var. angularis TaxID=157739 RepID=A0A0S3S9U2_PHAAN|nr:hypothetical protein VIGAN_06054500 [Vigna angularis var. angularis]
MKPFNCRTPPSLWMELPIQNSSPVVTCCDKHRVLFLPAQDRECRNSQSPCHSSTQLDRFLSLLDGCCCCMRIASSCWTCFLSKAGRSSSSVA